MVGVSGDPLTLWASSQQGTKEVLRKSVLKRGMGWERGTWPMSSTLSYMSCANLDVSRRGLGRAVTNRQQAAGSRIPFEGGVRSYLGLGERFRVSCRLPQLNPKVSEQCLQAELPG